MRSVCPAKTPCQTSVPEFARADRLQLSKEEAFPSLPIFHFLSIPNGLPHSAGSDQENQVGWS
jgi:hypothetical protein